MTGTSYNCLKFTEQFPYNLFRSIIDSLCSPLPKRTGMALKFMTSIQRYVYVLSPEWIMCAPQYAVH